MEKIRDSLLFIGRAPRSVRVEERAPVKWKCDLYLLNFSKLLHSAEDGTSRHCKFGRYDLLHGVAAVLSQSLPDMELSAIYNSLTAPTTSTLLLLTNPHCVVTNRSTNSHKEASKQVTLPVTTPTTNGSAGVAEDVENPFAVLVSDDEDSAAESEDEPVEDRFEVSRQNFIESAVERKKRYGRLVEESVGSEDCVLGCAAFCHLPAQRGLASAAAVQLSLLAVRRKCRRSGMGRHLMQTLKDPEVVGQYEALLTFADHKAVQFFKRHGFSEDVLVSARYRPHVEHWENSSLMVFVPPFSEAGLAVGSLKSLSKFQDVYQQWRQEATSSYSTQVGLMERLRHELLLLHSKIESQEELMTALNKELRETRQAKVLVEQEFQLYRDQSQKLLCDKAADTAEKWLEQV